MQTEQPNYALRPYCEEDYQAIAKLIAQTWEFDTFCTPQQRKQPVEVFMQTEQPNYALRPYCEEDYQAIAKLIAQTWEFDTFCTPQVAKLLSYVYLDECLVEQNFAQVAICNNQIAGIIMGNSFCDHCALKQDQLRLAHNQDLDECLVEQNFAQVAICNNQIAGIIMGNSFCDHCALKQDQLRLAHNQEALNSTVEGREVSSFFEQIYKVDDTLLTNTGHQYQGKVELFIVNSAFQGLGLGKKLFASCLEFFKRKKVNDFYIFTDSSCNFGFYDHMGMKCQGHEKLFYQENGEQQCLDMFIYDNSPNHHQGCPGHNILSNSHGSFLKAV